MIVRNVFIQDMIIEIIVPFVHCRVASTRCYNADVTFDRAESSMGGLKSGHIRKRVCLVPSIVHQFALQLNALPPQCLSRTQRARTKSGSGTYIVPSAPDRAD